MLKIMQDFPPQLEVAGSLQVRDHLLGQVLVLSDEDVHVVSHDDARVAGIFLGSNDFSKSSGDRCDNRGVEEDGLEPQIGLRFGKEIEEFISGGL